MDWWDELFVDPPQVEDGMIALPKQPGLGLTLDEAAVRRYAGRAGDAENGAALILALNGLSGAGALRPGAALKVPGFAGR